MVTRPRYSGGRTARSSLWAHSVWFSDDALAFAEQSFRSGPRLEFGHAQCTDSERISQGFGHEHFGATTRHGYWHPSRIEDSPLLARLRLELEDTLRPGALEHPRAAPSATV